MKFTEFGFSDKILKALETFGFEEATEVQNQAIPLILAGKNIVVRSQTGSGKTFAFALPLLQNTSTDILFPETLIICPTRELTLQVCDEIKKITGFMENVRVTPIYGGSNITRQVQALKRKPQIIVGTPGRILDHIERKTLKLHYLKNVVLDEADEMLNMGFKEDIEMILKGTPENKRTLLFSATYPERIKQIVEVYMPEHEKVEIGSENKSLKNISQQYVLVNKKDKTDALVELLNGKRDKRILIFCNTKAMTEKISETLKKSGFEAHSLHGDLKQSQRKMVTNDFKFKKINVLVASDVAARGLDINDIDYVINYDLPTNLEYFLHRMGRTARAGKNGNAITIITSKTQVKDLKDFERQTESSITELKLTNFAYDSTQEQSPAGKSRRPERNSGNSFGGSRRSDNKRSSERSGTDKRSSERKGYEGRKFENKDSGRSSESRSFDRKSSERSGTNKRSSERKGYEGRKFEGKDSGRNSENRSFDRKPSDKKGFSSKRTYGEKPARKSDGSDKNFRNKATTVKSDFDVSERVFEKVKRKKEMAFGTKFENERSSSKSTKPRENTKFDRKPSKFDKKDAKNTSKSKSFDKKGKSSNFGNKTKTTQGKKFTK